MLTLFIVFLNFWFCVPVPLLPQATQLYFCPFSLFNIPQMSKSLRCSGCVVLSCSEISLSPTLQRLEYWVKELQEMQFSLYSAILFSYKYILDKHKSSCDLVPCMGFLIRS